MKRIKRAVAVLLAVMMVFSVIGCGGSSGSKKSDSSSKETKDAKTEEVWGNKSGQDEICGDPDGKYTIGVVIHTTTDFLCAKYTNHGFIFVQKREFDSVILQMFKIYPFLSDTKILIIKMI